MDIASLLSNTLSHDRTTREDATQTLEHLSQENYTDYVTQLCKALTDEQLADNIRLSAGIAMKNSLSSKEFTRRQAQSQRWLSVDDSSRTLIKQMVLSTLASSKKLSSYGASQVICAIAEIELCQRQWPDLIPTLLDNVTATDDVNLKQATLKTIGYICETVSPDVLSDQSNEILTAVIQGTRKEEECADVRLEATRALYNSIEFARSNFERQTERDFIMQVVCEATQSESSDIKVCAHECLGRIMQLYYGVMHFYMEGTLLRLTVSGINDPDDKVVFQAIEFWSTVCEVEIQVKGDMEQAHEIGEPPESICHDFAGKALGYITPVLLCLLTKQDENEDEDEWTVSMSSATCLSLLAQCVRNAIIPHVVPFVETNIGNEDWKYREAAVMAFGAILDGPNTQVLIPLVDQALSTLITMMQDPVLNVKYTVAWTLSRICELHPTCIQPDVHLHHLITFLLHDFDDNPRIVANCCWSLMNLAEKSSTSADCYEPTTALSVYYEGILTTLLRFTDRNNNQANCRTCAYEAISSLITYSPNDCIPLVQNVVLTTLDRLEASISMENQILNADDRSDQCELQSNLLGVITNSIRRLPQDITHISDRIMTLVLQLLTNSFKKATMTEDALLTIGAMAILLEDEFLRYAGTFVPLLLALLQNPQDYQLCLIAVDIIGDLCHALGPLSAPYCRSFMQLLITHLSSPHRSVKPRILSSFGDIAQSIGKDFEPYLELVMTVLLQAQTMRADRNNIDLVDYINTLHEGCVEAYVGIIQGMHDSANVQALLPYLESILNFTISLSLDQNRSDDLTCALLGLIGDLAETFGTHIKPYIGDWLNHLLKEVAMNRHASPATKKTGRWAKEKIHSCCQ